MAVKIDVLSGFVGSGKTTLMNRILPELTRRERVSIIENEFGEINIDSSILAGNDIEISEISGGCICCTLFGNFVMAVKRVIDEYKPDRILIEPTGLGKLTDVMSALALIAKERTISLNVVATIVDPTHFEMYMTMFGEFFSDQICEADTVVLSRTQFCENSLLEEVVQGVLHINPNAHVISCSWNDIEPAALISDLEKLGNELPEQGYAHARNHCEHDEECEHKHHHGFQEQEDITSLSVKGGACFEPDELESMILSWEQDSQLGLILRAKGYFESPDGTSYRYDYVPGEFSCYEQKISHTPRHVFIGKHLDKARIEARLMLEVNESA